MSLFIVRIRAAVIVVASLGALSLSAVARASVNPFTETFTAGASNWYNPLGTAPAQWIGSGGPDGSPHITTAYNFRDLTPGLPFPNNAVNLFRAQDEFNSSNHAFEGNWIADGVNRLSLDVRHDSSSPLTFFVRFSTPGNFPAWSGVEFVPVIGSTWAHIEIPISLSNPNLFYEGPPGGPAEFNAVFSNIGHIQVGVFAGSLAGVDQDVHFDLDNVSIVPAPAAALMLGASFMLFNRRRRSGAAA